MQLEEGIELAQAALKIEQEADGEMEARACLFVGIGYQMKAQASSDLSHKAKDVINHEHVYDCPVYTFAVVLHRNRIAHVSYDL